MENNNLEEDILFSIIDSEEDEDSLYSISPTEPMTYRQMKFMESKHWYFKYRIKALSTIIDSFITKKDADILDIGVGTGTISKLLEEKGNCIHIDCNDKVIYDAKENGIEVLKCNIPWNMSNLEDKKFDYIIVFNFIEYLDKDVWGLDVIKSYLKKDGKILLTTLTNPIVFDNNDKLYGVKRRYSEEDLNTLLFKCNLKAEKKCYFENPPLSKQLSSSTDAILSENNIHFNYIAKDNNLNYDYYIKELKKIPKCKIKSGNQIFLLLSIMNEEEKQKQKDVLLKKNEKENKTKLIDSLIDKIVNKETKKEEIDDEEMMEEINEMIEDLNKK